MEKFACGAASLVAALFAASALAQPAAPITSLRQAFDAAWERQPDARSLASRRDAALAGERVAGAFAAQPPSLSLATRTGRFTGDGGRRDYEAGLSIPLWLPGEQSRAQALAAAELESLAGRAGGARLRIAGEVRESYWQWQRARIDRDTASRRLENARQLEQDVAKRLAAGELSRADSHQAQGAVATAEAVLAEAEAVLASAVQSLLAITGSVPSAQASRAPEPEPTEAAANHPALVELDARRRVAERALELAGIQHRGNPEASVAATRERGAFGDAYENTLTFGVRVPFGSDDRRDLRTAQARAELQAASVELELARSRLAAAADSVRARVQATRAQLTAAERRAALAAETRGFYERAFRLGEADLPTRLRIELEAGEAERAAARVRVDRAATVSQLRQSLGLLPE